MPKMEARNQLAPRGIISNSGDIGRRVVYRAAPDYKAEEGVITSAGIGQGLIFVRYGDDVNSKATSRRDLDWLYGTEKEKPQGQR